MPKVFDNKQKMREKKKKKISVKLDDLPHDARGQSCQTSDSN